MITLQLLSERVATQGGSSFVTLSDVSALITGLATVVLVVVTWRYARTTRRMAQEATRSAAAAEAAAKASNAAAETAASGLSVSFVVRPRGQAGVEKGSWTGLELLCTGATVYVHEVEVLDFATLESPSDDFLSERSPFTEPNRLPARLEINDFRMPTRYGYPEIEREIPEIPVRMFAGDVEFFQFPAGVDFEDANLFRVTALVMFSVSKDGPTAVRRVRGKATKEDLLLWYWPIDEL